MDVLVDRDKLPRFLPVLEQMYPGAERENVALMHVGNCITGMPAKDDFHRALQCQTTVALEHYGGMLSLVSDKLGFPAEGVCRNLFEVVVGAVYLAEHPQKLTNFLDYGKFLRYRQIRASKTTNPVFQQKQHAEIAQTDVEYAALQKRFKKTPWHGASVEVMTKDAGMTNLYDVYYRRASSVAHGDAFNIYHFTSKGWQIGIAWQKWDRAARTAMIFGYQLLVLLFERLNQQLKLRLDHEIQILTDLMNQMTAKDMQENAP
jgi:Family of unknown function (DUF5677)